MNRCAIASREHCRPQPKVKIFYERKSKKKEQKPKRRVPVTASIAWPTSIREMDERSKIRWQHRLKREHPTGTERRSLLEECGWKGGDSGLLGERANLCPTKKQKNSLDSDRPSHGRRLRLKPLNERNRDVTTATRKSSKGKCARASLTSMIAMVCPPHFPL